MMNLISLQSYSPEQIASVIDISIQIKQDQETYEHLLDHKKMYMLFEKTSTRTALGFSMGFMELGGKYFLQRWEESNFAVGDVIDEARYVATNVDVILARLKHHEDIAAMGDASPVPVINGCCDKFHPTQALADCMTVKELFGTYEKTVLYIGIWNYTFQSLVNSLPRLGGKLIGVCPVINEATISSEAAQQTAKGTPNFEFYSATTPEQLKELVNSVDVVYVDTWVDMEFFNNPEFQQLKEERIALMKPYGLTTDLLKDSPAKVLHDMPMHPGYEIDRDTIETHINAILQQGENRRHVAKGIFCHLLGITL
jgi:ornithine carbamoyltransferase